MTTFAVASPPSQRLIDWIKDRIPPEYGLADWDPNGTLCTLLLDEEGEPIVATAIDGFTTHSCELTIASDGTQRWATPKFICGTYDFIFRTLPGLNRVSMITASCNEAALLMHKALGHVQEGVHRDYFGPGRDAISFSYLRSDWLSSRWHARSNRSRSVNTPNSRGATHGQEFRGRGPDSGVHDGVDGPGPKQSADGPGGHAS